MFVDVPSWLVQLLRLFFHLPEVTQTDVWKAERTALRSENASLREEAKTLRELAEKKTVTWDPAPPVTTVWAPVWTRHYHALPEENMRQLAKDLQDSWKGERCRVKVTPILGRKSIDVRTSFLVHGYDPVMANKHERTGIRWKFDNDDQDGIRFGAAMVSLAGGDPLILVRDVSRLLRRPAYGLGYIDQAGEDPAWSWKTVPLHLEVVFEVLETPTCAPPEVRWVEVPVAVTPPTPVVHDPRTLAELEIEAALQRAKSVQSG